MMLLKDDLHKHSAEFFEHFSTGETLLRWIQAGRCAPYVNISMEGPPWFKHKHILGSDSFDWMCTAQNIINEEGE